MKQALLVIDIQEALDLSDDVSISQVIASINDLISTYPKDHIHTFNSSTLSKQDIKDHYLKQFILYGERI